MTHESDLASSRDLMRRTQASRRFVLLWLTAVFSINFLDRQVLSLFAQPIKAEFELTDSMVGLLYGIGFALIYGTGGFPIAKIADRGMRVPIINWALMFFSAMTAVSAFAGGFWQLAIARVGVAAGESGTNPPSHSIIADLYRPRERSIAMATFSLGPHIGVLAGFLVLAWIGGHWGWRAAFVSVGIFGICVSLLGMLMIAEPQRGERSGDLAPGSVVAALQIAFKTPAARHVFIGATLFSTFSNAILGWLPSMLVRHGMSVTQVGNTLAIVLGLVGGCGTLLGGILSDKISGGDPCRRLMILAALLFLSCLAWVAVFRFGSPTVIVTLLVLPAGLLGFYLGPTFSTIQALAAPQVRAMAAAALVFSGNVIGLSLGPLMVGAMSDILTRYGVDQSLDIALTCITPLCLWSSIHYWAAARTVNADIPISNR